MYKKDLALNKLQWLIWHKIQPNQTPHFTFFFILFYFLIFFTSFCVFFGGGVVRSLHKPPSPLHLYKLAFQLMPFLANYRSNIRRIVSFDWVWAFSKAQDAFTLTTNGIYKLEKTKKEKHKTENFNLLIKFKFIRMNKILSFLWNNLNISNDLKF